jgi:hypothetical protein
MIDVLTLFPNTIGQEEFDNNLSNIVTAFRGADGLRSVKISAGHIMSPGGPPPYSKVIEASFESLELFMAWVESPAAQSMKDLFTDSGIVRLFYEVNDL